LLAIVAKAMGPLATRYRTAGALAADLRAFLGGLLVAAHHYTPAQHVVRFVRRHRIAVGVGAIATVVAIALGAAAIVNIMRSRDEASLSREQAEDRAQVALLAEAESLAERDPARAVLRLGQLPKESPYGAKQRDIAVAAAFHGVAHG